MGTLPQALSMRATLGQPSTSPACEDAVNGVTGNEVEKKLPRIPPWPLDDNSFSTKAKVLEPGATPVTAADSSQHQYGSLPSQPTGLVKESVGGKGEAVVQHIEAVVESDTLTPPIDFDEVLSQHDKARLIGMAAVMNGTETPAGRAVVMDDMMRIVRAAVDRYGNGMPEPAGSVFSGGAAKPSCKGGTLPAKKKPKG